ncbi:MAG: DNA mismatch repair protein MutS [Gemmatimonadaceae bacterium]
MTTAVATPLMQQYREIKARHQNAILFFRMGDFYETFGDDALTASRVLGITLTTRNNGGASEVPLAGVPVKAVQEYLRRMVSHGFRVAICEQMEDPKVAKGIVRREVVETVTPGAAFADDLLDGARNNFLCAVHVLDGRSGIAAVDVTTGELRLFVASGTTEMDSMFARLAPREIIVATGSTHSLPTGVLVTPRDRWEFDDASARDTLAGLLGVHSLVGFGIGEEDAPAVAAAGALLRYLRELQPGGIPHLMRPVVERAGGVMPLDEMTRRNLELIESLRGGSEGTLLDVLDRTLTPMGGRMLRQWLLAPLLDRAAIDGRLDAVAALVAAATAREALRETLDGVRDVERLAGKAAAGRATPRELGALGDSLRRLPAVEAAARRLTDAGAIHAVIASWDACADVALDIGATLVDRPPPALGDESAVRPGVDAQLDELCSLRDGGRDAIARMQAEERARTGISSLKIGYNKVFGYFIEITHANQHRVPADYQRRQTLAGAERYVTPALQEFEERVLTATEQIASRERTLFEALRARVAQVVARLQCVARAIAELDALASLADAAAREGYVRPEISDDFALDIVRGRHPVVERMMPRDRFIPNDVGLATDARLIVLTGPNMAGKSTILRQVGLTVLMAQMGSFVPAERARIGLVDRVFTRVGASDNLARGQSTFMVEMSETSAILHSATTRSLVLLDEIGRGTSTYDGVSIAWAVSEYLHDTLGCKCIFATHYHELTQLAEQLRAVRNFNVGVREVEGRVVFLHRLQTGGADRSYGIEVGRLAGLPERVLARAKEVLGVLEGEHIVGPATGRLRKGARDVRREQNVPQLALFRPETPTHPVVDQLRKLEPDAMTPLEALTVLARLKAEIDTGAPLPFVPRPAALERPAPTERLSTVAAPHP